jgi:hypothetical protein
MGKPRPARVVPVRTYGGRGRWFWRLKRCIGMRKDNPNEKNRGHRQKPGDKAAAMRDAVRKAIESLIEKKGPAKGHPRIRCGEPQHAWA